MNLFKCTNDPRKHFVMTVQKEYKTNTNFIVYQFHIYL